MQVPGDDGSLLIQTDEGIHGVLQHVFHLLGAFGNLLLQRAVQLLQSLDILLFQLAHFGDHLGQQLGFGVAAVLRQLATGGFQRPAYRAQWGGNLAGQQDGDERQGTEGQYCRRTS